MAAASGSWEDPPSDAGYTKLEKANAARHFSFVCRALRSTYGSAKYAEALGDAHEARSQDEHAIYIAISDKLNNLLLG